MGEGEQSHAWHSTILPTNLCSNRAAGVCSHPFDHLQGGKGRGVGRGRERERSREVERGREGESVCTHRHTQHHSHIHTALTSAWRKNSSSTSLVYVGRCWQRENACSSHEQQHSSSMLTGLFISLFLFVSLRVAVCLLSIKPLVQQVPKHPSPLLAWKERHLDTRHETQHNGCSVRRNREGSVIQTVPSVPSSPVERNVVVPGAGL